MPTQPSIVLAGVHPDHPGWNEWRIIDQTRFNGAVLGLVLVRLDSTSVARIRIFPKHHMTNVNEDVHGAIVLALSDISLFAGPAVLLGTDVSRGVTIELGSHFVGTGDPALPLDALVEVVKETGRMIFSRGTIVQDDNIVSYFSGIIRKPPQS